MGTTYTLEPQGKETMRVWSRFVTCSEIWSLFLADDLLYSLRLKTEFPNQMGRIRGEPQNTTAEGAEELQRREDAKHGGLGGRKEFRRFSNHEDLLGSIEILWDLKDLGQQDQCRP